MPRQNCYRRFDRAAITALLDTSEASDGHTFAMHLLPNDNREGFLRNRLAAAPAAGTPRPEAVCGFLRRDDIIDVVLGLLNSDRGQCMLSQMDDGGEAGNVCEEAAQLALNNRISYGAIARKQNSRLEEYTSQPLTRAQLYARRYVPLGPNDPPFFVVTCFPTERPVGMSIDSWGTDYLISGSLFQQHNNVHYVEENKSEQLKQAALAYAYWLQSHLGPIRGGMRKIAVAKILPGLDRRGNTLKQYYETNNALRRPVGVNTLTLQLFAQGYLVTEEHHGGFQWLMISDGNA